MIQTMMENKVIKKAKFKHANGLHARIAAMIIQKSNELQRKYNTEIYKIKLQPRRNILNKS